MKTRMNRLGLLAAMGMVLGIASAVPAATITYLGQDQSTVPSWRDSTVAKPAALIGGTNGSGDPNGDKVYGSDGYYVLVGSTTPTSSLPSYISGVTEAAGLSKFSSSNYASINDPTVVGGLPNKNAGLWYKNVGSAEQDFLTITLAGDSTFIMGVIGSTWGAGSGDNYNFNRLRVRQTVGGSADSTLLTVAFAIKNPYYDFFQISGVAGDQFTVSAQRTPATLGVSMTGITFEAVPEPATLGLMALGGLMMVRGRGR
ncbi:MAG: PEP-CTERM sorting domain-containing protein [Phycisphaerales bacterium]